MTHTTQHNAATLHAALMAAAAAAPEFQNNEIGKASRDVSNASRLRAVYFDDGLIDRIQYAQRMEWKETQGEWLIQTTMEETFSELAATCDQSPRHVKFQTATGRIKLVNTAERLQRFADAMAKSKTAWTLWGGGAMPAELAKPKKAKPANTWQTTSVNVCVQLFEDKLHADGLAMALDRLGGRAYWHNEPGKKNEPFLMIAPQPVAGLPERLASGRHAIGGAWSVYDTISGLAIGNSYKPARSRAAAERLALDLLSKKTPEQLETAFNRAKPNDAAEALARLCQVLKIDDTAEALAAAQAQADADALAAEAQAAAPVATVESEFSWMTAAPAAKSVVIPVATPDDTTAEQWALTAAIVHAALVFERCTNILNYDAARRAAIESGRQGKPGAVAYIKAGLLPYTTTGIARHEAKAALNRLAQAEADALAAEAQAAAPAADTTPAAPVATPADAVAALVADAVAAVAIDAAQETARGAELATFAEPEWSKKWAADMADAMAQIEAMKAEREAKRIERMQAAADASTDADADTCTADAVADATEAQASTATGTATPGHTTAPRAMASTAGAQPGHSGGRGQLVAGKSGRWVATFHTTAAGLPGMLYTGPDGVASAHEFDTGSARMAALQAMARSADAPTDTPPTGGLPCPVESAPAAHTTPVAVSTPDTPPAVSSADSEQAVEIGYKMIKGHRVSWLNNGRVHIGRELFDKLAVDSESIDWTAKTPGEFEEICALIAKPSASDAPIHPRNIIPEGGMHIVDDAFEAWTYHHEKSDRFGFVMYIGKQSKPFAYYGYATEAKRNEGLERHAQQARDILASKARRKAEDREKLDAGHGLQVGDVVRSSWGYDQTNVNHYQIVKVIGKRTVEVRSLAVHEESTGHMSGDVAPIWGDFVGEVLRRTVDRHGAVNMLGETFGRAYKIEPVAVVHGVRCYAASGCSSYA